MKADTPPQRPLAFRSGPVFAGRGLIARQLRPALLGSKFAILLLLQLLSVTILLPQSQAPAASTAISATPLTKASAYANARLTYKIIDASKYTFSYDVYVEGRLMIHQPRVPAFPSNEGFEIKADADKMARLAMNQIKDSY